MKKPAIMTNIHVGSASTTASFLLSAMTSGCCGNTIESLTYGTCCRHSAKQASRPHTCRYGARTIIVPVLVQTWEGLEHWVGMKKKKRRIMNSGSHKQLGVDTKRINLANKQGIPS